MSQIVASVDPSAQALSSERRPIAVRRWAHQNPNNDQAKNESGVLAYPAPRVGEAALARQGMGGDR